MGKTRIRIASFLLALHLLLMLLPVEALAAEGDVPRSGEILSIALDENEGTARVSLQSNGNSRFVIALYNGDGKLLSTTGAEVSGDTAAQNISVALPEARPEHYEIEAFLLNRETSAPLCESFHTDSTCAAAVFMDDYTISGVELCPERNGFDITGSTAGECNAQVTLFSEEGERLFRETAAAAQESLQMESMRVALQGDIPRYFIVRVVLCNEKGYPLSAPYTTMAYTQAHERFDAQTPEDFPEEQVLNFGSSGFGVLTEDVTKVEAPAAASGDSAYTYAAANVPAEGAVLLVNVGGAQTPVKVKSAAKNADGTVTVERDPEATLSDFYDVLKLDTTIDVGEAAENNGRAQLMDSAVPMSDVQLIELSNQIKTEILTVTVSGTATLKIKASYDKKIFGKDYVEWEAYIETSLKATSSISAPIPTKSSDLKDAFGRPLIPEIELYKGPIAIVGIASVQLKITVPLEFSFTVKGTAEVGFSVKRGFKYNSHDGFQSIDEHDKPENKFEIEGSFEIKFGPKVELDVLVLLGLFEGGISGQAGVSLKASTKAAVDSSATKRHACKLCLDGEVSLFIEFKGDIICKVTDKLQVTLLSIDLLSNTWDLGHVYASIINDEDSVFQGKPSVGTGECPNYQYQVTVETTDMSDQEVRGNPVYIRKDGEQICEGTSRYQCYLYPGVYTAATEFNSIEFKKSFEVKKEPVSLTLRENMSHISGTVTDALTGEPVSGVTVTTTGANGETITRTTNAEGKYYLTVYHGTYIVTFSSASYRTGSGTWIVEQDRAVVDADIQLRPNSAAYLSGRVTGGSSPSVRILQDGAAPRPVSLSLTNSFALLLPAGTYTIEAINGLDQEIISETITLAAGEDRTVQLRFSQTGILRGTVRKSDGTPISGATVSAGDEGSAVTDSNGRYELVLPVGTHSVLAAADGYASSSPVSVTVTKNAEIQRDFQLAANEGTCGPNLTWKLENGVLTISGTGEMYNYSYSTIPWKEHTDTISLLIIGSGVTSIGSNAFYDCTGLTNVTIPDGVTRLDRDVFYGCTCLTSITIPDSVTFIGSYAFNRCTGLTSVTIPNSVTFIGSRTFECCTSLTSITIPDSVSSIGDYAFYDCTDLTSITIPDGVSSIEEHTFYGCTSLTSITIPDSVSSIGRYAFAGCTGLTSITIPNNVTKIGDGAFFGCTGLTSITIPDSVSSIGSGAFKDCTSLTSIYYNGTQEQWNNISKSANSIPGSATIHFS